MKTSKKGLDTFLESTETIDWEGTEVERKSNELTQNVSNEIEKAIVLFNWVRDEILLSDNYLVRSSDNQLGRLI
jgi:hypothetical protein